MKNQEIKWLTAVLEAMLDGIYIIDQQYTIVYMNRPMIDNFGSGIGKRCFEIIGQQKEKCPWCRAEEVFQGETIHQEILHPQKQIYYDHICLPIKNINGRNAKLSIYRDITEQKENRQKLIETEKGYQRLFEKVGAGVFISSKEGRFLDANPALLKMLGYADKEEFLSLDIATDLYLHPRDRQKFQRLVEKTGQVVDYEARFKCRDGGAIPVLLTADVRYDRNGLILGYEGIVTDQSQRHKMERELKEAHDFLNKIIHSSPNAIMATDMQGNIILWNRSAEEIIGYKAVDVIGKMNIRKIYPEGMAQKVMRFIRSPDHGRPGRLEFFPMVHVRHDGNIAEGNLSAAVVTDEDENEVAVVGIFVDLKERLAMERQLRETQEHLLQSEKLAAMGRLTSQIAHELNNPLYGIMNTLELLKTEIRPGNKRRRILEMALSETMRVSELLKKMLSFSKPDQEQKQPTDINTIIDEIAILCENQLREQSIKIERDFCANEATVNASKNQLRQVFLNLIANAKDAMPQGGCLRVKTQIKANQVVIDFTDNGIGIQDAYLDKVFDSFFTTKESIEGVGLGLSVCYDFIKAHDGDIRVASKLNQGTTFSITLPYACA